MKQYNCPDCKVKENSCEGCQRYCENIKSYSNATQEKSFSRWDYLKEETISEYDFPKVSEYDYPKVYDNTPIYTNFYNHAYDCCKHCGNNPANGGSGICNCTLPYMSTTGCTGNVIY